MTTFLYAFQWILVWNYDYHFGKEDAGFIEYAPLFDDWISTCALSSRNILVKFNFDIYGDVKGKFGLN